MSDPTPTPAPAACAGCATALPAGARFCPACGRAVAADPAGEERRLVTVLFADLVGFTALAEHRDPESVKELLDACFDRLVPVIDEHGGHVDKIIGDELMAVFGAPTAHEDDPERAVRAGLALVDALAAVDPTLGLRVGINTGEVLAGAVGPAMGYTVTGDVVNTAHRLATAASPGQVLVGDRTHRTTAEVVGYRLVGDLELKGKADLVRAWVAGTTADGPHHRGPEGRVLPLVGRDRELGELRTRLAGALDQRRVEVVTLVGEAGVGKTRLGMELAVLLAAPPLSARVLWVSCPSYGPGADLAPLADLVRAGLGIGTSAAPWAQEDRLVEEVRAVAQTTGSDPAVLRRRLGLLLGLGGPSTRPVEPDPASPWAGITDQQLGATRAVLDHVSSIRPTLVVIDDLHWAGPGVLRFLAGLPDRLAGRPLAVLALGRDELLERRTSLVDAGPGRTTRSLDPLGDAASAELVDRLLAEHDDARIGPAALHRLVTSAGGSPLLLEQLVRYLVESGGLAVVEDRWMWTDEREGNEASLPDGIRSLIGARLDGLAPDERSLVGWAAVVGRRFWRDALADLARPDVPVDDALARLDARGFTQPIEDTGHGDHAFRHVLTRDVAYASLPIGDRANRHARVADWLERRAPEADDGAALALLAYHYERAVVLARAVDHTDPGLAGRAFAALVRAGRSEHRRDGLRRADHWYRRARDLGSFDAAAMLDAVEEHGTVLLELRQLDAARDAFEEVLWRAEATDPGRADLAVAHLGAVARLQGDADAARDRFETATDRLVERGDLAGQVAVLRLQGWAEITAGRPRAALPRLRRAERIEAELTEPERRGETLRLLGWCEFLSGDLAAAQAHLWSAMAHSADAGDEGSVGWCFGLLAQSFLYAGKVAQSREVAGNLRDVARRYGDSWGEWTCAVLDAAGLVAQGDARGAHALAAEAEQAFKELGEAWGLTLARLVRAQALRVDGDHAAARAVLVTALAAAGGWAHVGEDARLLAELARVELEAGEDVAAERRARAALARVRAGVGDHESGLRAQAVLAEVERRAGAADAAELLLEEAAAAEVAPADRTDGWRNAAAALAEMRLDAGDRAGAAELLARAHEPPTEEVGLVARLAALEARLGGRGIGEGEPASDNMGR